MYYDYDDKIGLVVNILFRICSRNSFKSLSQTEKPILTHSSEIGIRKFNNTWLM
jgi:hypothetical protein